ncbi:MAG TPA: efflux RND transporter permease subunit [Bacteroidota bacterium]|nr:efflux RND transporter permease subunit [Bacteroidota bacterium]
MGLFSYCRRHAKALLFTMAVFAIGGVAMMLHLPVSLFPDITFPRIVILGDNGEEPAERMMVEVTKPLEEVAIAVPGVRTVRSTTSRGSTEISIGLDWSSDVQQTLGLLQGRIANIRNELPATASVQSEQMTVAVFPIIGYSLTSDTLSLVELRDIALYQIRPALLRVAGVARVEITGGESREFLVKVNPDRLASYGMTIQQVSDAVEETNFVESTGLMSDNYQLYLSLVSGLLKTREDVANIVITARGGVPIRVSDVASVEKSVADQYIRTTAHGRSAVLINVLKQPTASTVRIGADISDVIHGLTLPGGAHLEIFYDQGDFIRSSIAGVRDSMLIGIALAMVIVFVFLRSWRLTLVVLIIVPVTIAMTFLCLGALGKTINIMTLGGIAAAVGLIIDDSIVIIEFIFTKFASLSTADRTPLGYARAVEQAIHSLMPAIIGSTASTIVIHIPLAFLGGVTGAFFTSLSITMVCALTISFLLSITLAPLLALILLRSEDIEREITHEHRGSRIAQLYEDTTRRLLRHKILVVPFVIGILAVAFLLYSQLGSSFMPEMDEGTFILDYISPAGTSLAETNRILTHVENILQSIPEVESYSRRTGTQLGFFITEPNVGDYTVKLHSKRARSIEEVISEVRERVHNTEPALQIDFGQLMMDVIGDLTNSPQPIEIKIFGEDADVLRSKAREVKSLIESVPGVVDAFDGIVISGPSLVIHVDPQKAAFAGFTTRDVLVQVQNIMQGRVDTKVQKGEKLIGIHIRYPAIYREDINHIEELKLVSPGGNIIPLRTIASFERVAGEAEIERDQLQQRVAVTARTSGRDLGSVMTDVKKLLAAKLRLPSGVTIAYGGTYQTQQESFTGLFIVALIALLLVIIVLLFEFGEFTIPFSIFVINAMSLVGVFGALWLFDVTLNVSSLVGIVLIIGIVAENAIFVFHRMKQLQSEGATLDDALTAAVKMRGRPIVMTTLAAVLALLPLTLGIGAGAQMQQPLAVAVIGGFSVSSTLLFFALPPLYRLLRR